MTDDFSLGVFSISGAFMGEKDKSRYRRASERARKRASRLKEFLYV